MQLHRSGTDMWKEPWDLGVRLTALLFGGGAKKGVTRVRTGWLTADTHVRGWETFKMVYQAQHEEVGGGSAYC